MLELTSTTRSNVGCRKLSTSPISPARALIRVPLRIQPRCVSERSPCSPCLAPGYLRQDSGSDLFWSWRSSKDQINAKGFVDPTHARYASHPLYKYIQVNLQENILKSFLVNIFLTSLRKVISWDLQPTYLVSTQNMEYVRDALGMTNSRVGYVFLIDENLKIRWGGCADATDEEVRSLESCTGVLLKRLEREKLKGGHPSTSSEPLPRVSTY